MRLLNSPEPKARNFLPFATIARARVGRGECLTGFRANSLARFPSLERKQKRYHAMLPSQPPQAIFALHHAGDPFAKSERELVEEFNL